MRFRLLAGAAGLALLMATTACSGNLANNAYRVNRAYDGNVRHVERYDGNVRDGSYNGIRTAGRAMNNTARRTSRRLGNAVHNVGNINHRGTERVGIANHTTRHNAYRGTHHNTARNIGNTPSRVLQNTDNNIMDGVYSGSVNHVNHTAHTSHRNTNAYTNPNNFTNAIYREHNTDGIINDTAVSHNSRTLANNTTALNRNDNQNQHAKAGYLTSDNNNLDGTVVRNDNTNTNANNTNTVAATRTRAAKTTKANRNIENTATKAVTDTAKTTAGNR